MTRERPDDNDWEEQSMGDRVAFEEVCEILRDHGAESVRARPTPLDFAVDSQ